MRHRATFVVMLLFVLFQGDLVFGQVTEQQLERWRQRFPEADANGDGRLTLEEANAFRQKLTAKPPAVNESGQVGVGAPAEPAIDPGWQRERFPEHAICYRSPNEIAAVYAKVAGERSGAIVSYPKPADGSLRIVGTGHSFMAPGFQTFPAIARAAGFQQPPLVTHTGGGVTGSARYKWEEENGIFQFDGKPVPKLLASIANAEWDAMMWGPYYHDRPAYYACWIEFCLKTNPQMKFYLMNGWPQLGQLGGVPASEDELSAETIAQMGKIREESNAQIVQALNQRFGRKVFVLPTCEAMVLAVQYYHRGELPGVEGIHRLVGAKERSMRHEMIGHLGPGFDRLEGYVFYATMYGRSPELIEGDVRLGGSQGYPSRELDRTFRKIAWQAVIGCPLSGVADTDGNGIADDRQ